MTEAAITVDDLPRSTPVTLTLEALETLIKAKIEIALSGVSLDLDHDTDGSLHARIVSYRNGSYETVGRSRPLLRFLHYEINEVGRFDNDQELLMALCKTYAQHRPEEAIAYRNELIDDGLEEIEIEDCWNGLPRYSPK